MLVKKIIINIIFINIKYSQIWICFLYVWVMSLFPQTIMGKVCKTCLWLTKPVKYTSKPFHCSAPFRNNISVSSLVQDSNNFRKNTPLPPVLALGYHFIGKLVRVDNSSNKVCKYVCKHHILAGSPNGSALSLRIFAAPGLKCCRRRRRRRQRRRRRRRFMLFKTFTTTTPTTTTMWYVHTYNSIRSLTIITIQMLTG